FFFSSRRRHTRCYRDWSSDVCSSDLSLGQVFPVQEVLLVKIDLGQVLPPALDLHPAGGAGRIAAAVMRQRKAERLGRLQDRGVRRDLPAQALGMDERDPGHYATPPATATG